MTEREAYDEVYVYAMGRPGFPLQYVADTFTAQTATEDGGKAIAIVFALVGLYLHLERGFSGREVQRVHTLLAARKREWPRVPLPVERGRVTVVDVLAAGEGPERDLAIDRWAQCVWSAYQGSRGLIIGLLSEFGIG